MQDTTHVGAQHFCTLVGPRLPENARVLVAGCGKGHEAQHIYKTLGCEVYGFDIELNLDEDVHTDERFKLEVGSVLEIPLKDESIDAVFYHHVIEHVSDAAKSLDELARVLKPGGFLYVGTPNRHRLVGYVGSFDASFMDKVRWNMKDYGMRLRGKFRNELGAHAGFSHKELDKMLRQRFSKVEWLTSSYLNFKYGSKLPGPAMKLLTWGPVQEVMAPAIYAIATK